jgi:transposase-like protein
MPPARKSVPKPRPAVSKEKSLAAKTRKRYSAKFKLDAVKMISATDSCFSVARRLGLPPQTLYNWFIAYREENVAFSDAVRLTPEEKTWVQEMVQKRLSELSRKSGTAANVREIALLDQLRAKITPIER